MLKRVFFIVSLITINLVSHSQENTDFRKENFPEKEDFNAARQSFFDGIDFFSEKDYYNAIPHLVKAYKFNPNNTELNFKLGVSYLYTSEKFKAYEHLSFSQKLDSLYSKDINYYLGQAHHYLLEFEDAIRYYNLYKQNQSLDEAKIEEVDKKIDECNNGISLRENRSVGLIVNVKELNSEFSDYSPMITPDQSTMIFTSRRGSPGSEIDPIDLQYYENIYISYFENNKWTDPIHISEEVNSKNHDANVGISNDGQTIYVYNSTSGLGDIYKTHLEGTYWSEPLALSSPINSEFNEKCISISPDLKTSYFVSDRPGGIGGLDIYFSDNDANDNYTEAQNIGAVINTPYDEDGIFLHPDGRALYFSSKGHNSMGGYDIFKTVKDSNGIWSTPINLGQPINSADDDIFLFVSADGQTGYFSSIKEGGKGEKDIYKISFSEQDPGMNKSQLLLVRGKVVDALTKQSVKAEIEITNISTQKIITKINSNEASGEFMLSLPAGKNYGLTATHEDYLFYSENFNLSDTTSYLEIELSMPMSKIAENSSAVLRNIFFDYGQSILKPESKHEANRLYDLMVKYPKMTIEISGHTDNISSKSFNKELSKKRANSVANYLIKKGIDRKRFTTKGYGYSKPIADNNTERGRQKNRRVEFKIITK